MVQVSIPVTGERSAQDVPAHLRIARRLLYYCDSSCLERVTYLVAACDGVQPVLILPMRTNGWPYNAMTDGGITDDRHRSMVCSIATSHTTCILVYATNMS